MNTVERCERCGEYGQDRRTLHMKCLYQMSELQVPFRIEDDLYVLRVCKDCRGDWLKVIEYWFVNKPQYHREKIGWAIPRMGSDE